MTLTQRLLHYEKLMRLDKPIGILLLLWPTLWALWIAGMGQPSAFLVWIFVLGTVLMRSAGCVMNDYADRNIDGHVERTAIARSPPGGVLARSLAARRRPLAGGLPDDPAAAPAGAVAVRGGALSRCQLPLHQALLAIPRPISASPSVSASPWPSPRSIRRTADRWLMLLANVFWAVAYTTPNTRWSIGPTT